MCEEMCVFIFSVLLKEVVFTLEVVVLKSGSHGLAFFSITLLPPPLHLPVLSISSVFLQ